MLSLWHQFLQLIWIRQHYHWIMEDWCQVKSTIIFPGVSGRRLSSCRKNTVQGYESGLLEGCCSSVMAWYILYPSLKKDQEWNWSLSWQLYTDLVANRLCLLWFLVVTVCFRMIICPSLNATDMKLVPRTSSRLLGMLLLVRFKLQWVCDM